MERIYLKERKNGKGSPSTSAARVQKVEVLRSKRFLTLLLELASDCRTGRFVVVHSSALWVCLVTVTNCNFCVKDLLLGLVEPLHPPVWVGSLKCCSCTGSVFLPNFLLQCIALLFWVCFLRSPTLCCSIQFLEVFLSRQYVACTVNVLSLIGSHFFETILRH